MKAGRAAVLAAACGLLAGCHKEPDPYLSRDDPRGTPADRTGGARDIPWLHGTGPASDVPPPAPPAPPPAAPSAPQR